MIKAGPCKLMVVFGIGDGCSSSIGRFWRGDRQGVPLLSIFRASKWHEDVPRSSLLVLLEWDEETR